MLEIVGAKEKGLKQIAIMQMLLKQPLLER